MSLHIGKALNLNDLEEGDDVYFECSIQVIFYDNFQHWFVLLLSNSKRGQRLFQAVMQL